MKTPEMIHPLFAVEGRDEFVITPEPNSYIVVLRLPSAQAAVIGCDRLAVALEIEENDTAGVRCLYTVQENNDPGEVIEPENDKYSAPIEEIIRSLGNRLSKAVDEFYSTIGEERMEEYYVALQRATTLEAMLKGIMRV